MFSIVNQPTMLSYVINNDLKSIQKHKNEKDFHQRNKLGQNLLILSVNKNYLNMDIVNLLLSKGLDPHESDLFGYSAYDYAHQRNHTQALSLFSKKK